MDIVAIQAGIRANQYVYSQHADIERRADQLTFAQIEEAILNGEVLEDYPDTGRGESCLIVGFASIVPIHAVCGWRGDKVALITIFRARLILPIRGREEHNHANHPVQFLRQ